jgi:hypothetical protein
LTNLLVAILFFPYQCKRRLEVLLIIMSEWVTRRGGEKGVYKVDARSITHIIQLRRIF